MSSSPFKSCLFFLCLAYSADTAVKKIIFGHNLNSALEREWKKKKYNGNVRELQEIK